jgi:RNA polymerase sigma-70 factor, ECF subfamily
VPPQPELYVGRENVVSAWAEGFDTEKFGHMRGIVIGVNMQPAVACYLKRPGETEYRQLALDVLRIEDDAIAEVITFPPDLFPPLGLPPVL